jgi:hypothetical protein
MKKGIKPTIVFSEERLVERTVKVIIRPMTKEEARIEFPYRPFSKYSESRFGGDSLFDDTALLVSGEAKRCKMCRATTKLVRLKDGVCPDCDGCSECYGLDPRRVIK